MAGFFGKNDIDIYVDKGKTFHIEIKNKVIEVEIKNVANSLKLLGRYRIFLFLIRSMKRQGYSFILKYKGFKLTLRGKT